MPRRPPLAPLATRRARPARTLCLSGALALTQLAPSVANAQRAAGTAAQGNAALLRSGQQQYDDLRYEEAIQTLSAAIIRRGNSPGIEVQMYELLALSYLALNRNDEAEGAFRLMLGRAPERTLSNDLAPRVRQLFDTVKQRWIADGRPGVTRSTPGLAAPVLAPVAIEHRSPAQQERSRALGLTARVDDPNSRVARLVLAYRPGAVGIFRRIDATRARPGGDFHAEIPGDSVRPPALEYYFEAVDTNGVPVQSRGDALAPLRVVVPEPRGVPWWAWVAGGAGVVAVGVAITAVVLSTQSSPARLTVNVTGD